VSPAIFEKAHGLGSAAAETDTAANQHAMQALDLYRRHADEVAARKQEAAADQAVREAWRQAGG
jgi:hypothetical protein